MAFIEGWEFYGEEMFVRMGLRRAEWSYQQAAAFFATQTGFTKEQAEAAVAGIALNPGWVIAYTVGRVQLEDLLAAYNMGKMGADHFMISTIGSSRIDTVCRDRTRTARGPRQASGRNR